MWDPFERKAQRPPESPAERQPEVQPGLEEVPEVKRENSVHPEVRSRTLEDLEGEEDKPFPEKSPTIH